MVMFKRRYESGAVSLFLVVFAMLLITVVTLSFIRIMITDQQQASVSDLSKSAYDSSLAGVEDAKRALIYYRTVCATGDVGGCATAKATIDSNACNQGLTTVFSDITPSKEVLVQKTQSSADANGYNQAYTCVKMKLETPDYLGTVQANTSKIIPLKSTALFNTVTVEWYMSADLGSTGTTVSLIPTSTVIKPLYQQINWPSNRPSLLRVQLMQIGSNFTVGSFDAASSSATNSNAKTLFLYPTISAGQSTAPVIDAANFNSDNRQVKTGATQPVKCVSNLNAGGYACTVTITLPQAVGQTDDSRNAYLRLTPMYNATHFRVTLGALGSGILFDGVQPSIDSTGRANQQYRRVQSRVDFVNTSFPFPEAAIDVTGNLCKDFIVTTATTDFSGICRP
jgi:hypothetical protein